MNIFNIKNTDIKIFCNKIKVMKLYNQGDVDGDNLSTSKYSYSPPKFSAPTTSNLAALLQHHHPAVAMVEKDSRLFQLSKSCVGICTCCFNGCCLACPVEMWKICYKWLGAPLLLRVVQI